MQYFPPTILKYILAIFIGYDGFAIEEIKSLNLEYEHAIIPIMYVESNCKYNSYYKGNVGPLQINCTAQKKRLLKFNMTCQDMYNYKKSAIIADDVLRAFHKSSACKNNWLYACYNQGAGHKMNNKAISYIKKINKYL